MSTRLTIFLFLFWCFLSLNAQTFSEIKIVNDTAFKTGEIKPFSGKYIDYYPGNPKVEGYFKEGLKEGTFKYYDRYDGLMRIENYRSGKKYGECIGYYLDNYIEYKENFTNDHLDGDCYYWAPTGELEKVKKYSKGELISEKKFKLDSTVFRLVVYISSEANKTLFKDEICRQDSIELHVGKVVPKYTVIDSPYRMRDDTIIVLENFKVLSFGIGATLYIEPDIEDFGHIDFSSTVYSNILNTSVLNMFCKNYPREFDIYDIQIEDPNGYKYSLPDKRYLIRKTRK